MEWLIISESILKMFITITVGVGVLIIIFGSIAVNIYEKKRGDIKYNIKQENQIVKEGCIKQSTEESRKIDYDYKSWKIFKGELDEEEEEHEEIQDEYLLIKLMEEQDDERFYKWIERYHKHLKRVRNRQALYIKRKAKYGK